MPIRDRIVWGSSNPFSDPRLLGLDGFVREIRLFRRLPRGVAGGSVFKNLRGDLPARPPGYYKEYDLTEARGNRGKLRLVLGNGGEVYLTGDHYGACPSNPSARRQVVNMPC